MSKKAMSKKAPSPSPQSLAGTRILVGRARHQAGALSAELRQRGAEVIEIPFIEIRKPKSFKALDDALKNLSTYDWLILTSVNGVEAMYERMNRLPANAPFSRSGRTFAHRGHRSGHQKSDRADAEQKSMSCPRNTSPNRWCAA